MTQAVRYDDLKAAPAPFSNGERVLVLSMFGTARTDWRVGFALLVTACLATGFVLGRYTAALAACGPPKDNPVRRSSTAKRLAR